SPGPQGLSVRGPIGLQGPVGSVGPEGPPGSVSTRIEEYSMIALAVSVFSLLMTMALLIDVSRWKKGMEQLYDDLISEVKKQ
ncbi:unnamed protein product, partial [marine sediment metagenome]